MRASSALPIAAGLVCFVFATQPLLSDSASHDKGNGSIYITHVTVIDTEAGKELHNRTVIISGDRISQVREGKDAKPPASAKVVDGTGKYLIPGLWDMHVHAMYQPRIDSWMPLLVANGVLGIRDMGSPMRLADVNQLRDQIAAGTQIGPRIIDGGTVVDGRKPPYPRSEFFVQATTAKEGRDTVHSIKANGSDFVKVYTWLPRDVYFAIADEAKKEGIPFEGHVPFSVPVIEASDAGQKSMEHLYGVLLACSTREDELRGELLKGAGDSSYAEHARLEIYEPIASYNEEKAARSLRAWQRTAPGRCRRLQSTPGTSCSATVHCLTMIG